MPLFSPPRSIIRPVTRSILYPVTGRQASQSPNVIDLATAIANGAYVWRTYDGSAYTAPDEATSASDGSDIGRVTPVAPAIASLDQTTVGLKPKAVLDGLGHLAAEFDEADDVLSVSQSFPLKPHSYLFCVHRRKSEDTQKRLAELVLGTGSFYRILQQSSGRVEASVRNDSSGVAITSATTPTFSVAQNAPGVTTAILEPGRLAIRHNGQQRAEVTGIGTITEQPGHTFSVSQGVGYAPVLYQPNAPLTEAELLTIETELMAEIGRNLDGSVAEPDFDPATLYASGEQGRWFDSSDLSTLFQDTAMTVPVTADGDPVKVRLDKSGNGNHEVWQSGATRTYRTDGKYHWLEAPSGSKFATMPAEPAGVAGSHVWGQYIPVKDDGIMKASSSASFFFFIWQIGSTAAAISGGVTVPEIRINGRKYATASLTRADAHSAVSGVSHLFAIPSIEYTSVNWTDANPNGGYFAYSSATFQVPGARDYARIEVFPTVDEPTLNQMARWVGARTAGV